MSQPRKIFPLRLPESFHGRPANRPSLVEDHRKKLKQRTGNPEQLSPSKKVTAWQRKVYDNDVNMERKQFLVHPSKLSCDVPDWCKTTMNYFSRNEYQPRRRESRSEWERFDVFNREKKITFAEKDSLFLTRNRFSQPIEVTTKIGWEDRARSTAYKEVTPKIGTVDFRDLSVKKPQMKVGKPEFINTYTPF